MRVTSSPFIRRQTTREQDIYRHVSCTCDLDLDPMTLIHELHLDIPSKYSITNNEFSMSRLSKARVSRTDRQTDRCVRPNALRGRICGWSQAAQ